MGRNHNPGGLVKTIDIIITIIITIFSIIINSNSQ